MVIYFIIGVLFLGILLSPVMVKRLKHRSLYPMFPHSLNFGKRQITFKKAMDLMHQRGAKRLVETGVARAGLKNAKSDGASTIVFGLWAKQNGASLDSVDLSEENVHVANETISREGLSDYVSTHVSDSVAFLADYERPIDFLYLDSYDYDKYDKTEQKNCQIHHLKEFKAAEDNLHDDTIVLIDDCRLPGGGKGKEVLSYMEEKGWKRVVDAYQVLLTK
jgi:predicted O-methyltransferase YrrM